MKALQVPGYLLLQIYRLYTVLCYIVTHIFVCLQCHDCPTIFQQWVGRWPDGWCREEVACEGVLLQLQGYVIRKQLFNRLTIIHITTSKFKRTKEIIENTILWQFHRYFVFRGNIHVCDYIFFFNLMQTLRHGAKQTIKNGMFHSIALY